ncbi:MAG: cation-transporting P-type ATPase [Woeseiaceae bacterium]
MRQPITASDKTTSGQAPAAWSRSSEAVLRSFPVDPESGLDAAQVLAQRKTWGPNQLFATQPRRILSILLAQFKSIVVVLLLGAGLLALAFSEIVEAIAIFAVILINTSIGFLTEWRATRSMEALRQFARAECTLLRDGKIARAPADVLVPGDIVLLEAGDLVAADLRLVYAAKLAADESTLTGESLPVKKQDTVLDQDTAVLDRNNMVFKGTCITRGSGKGVVVGTATHTEFGKIFEQVVAAKEHRTPLEERLNALGASLAWAIMGIAVIIGVGGIVAGRELFLAIEVAIALSVAAIPEGLAIVATIALARGMWRLAKQNALVTRLSAVETLGATSVILTDKTGTLTENRMAVSKVLLNGFDVDVDTSGEANAEKFRVSAQPLDAGQAAALDELLRCGVLCNNASLEKAVGGEAPGVGDPTELALLVVAGARSLWRTELLLAEPEVHEDPFDPESKRMATVHQRPDGFRVAVKGAPESILPGCTAARGIGRDTAIGTAEREQWFKHAERLGAQGLRTIAIAEKSGHVEGDDCYQQLVLLGIVGMEDPARAGVDQAIKQCHSAGISVVMVTGDHAATARNIAIETGIVTATDSSDRFLGGSEVEQLFADAMHERLLAVRVFSRVTPEQKLKLIDLYQQSGHVVAMTGDGVNDAPALKKADIGIAMGLRGTAVAKEAAVMVLQDDEFNTIVRAVAHGRAIFANIRKFVVYLMSCNTSEVLVVTLATVTGAPLPLLPLQILFLNLVTDVFPALALGVGRGSRLSMARAPRPASESILTRTHWMRIGLHGAVMAATVLAAMAISIFFLNFDTDKAVTVAFCTLALAQMWHVFNMRDEIKKPLDNEVTRNRWIWAALLICLALVLAAIYLPALGEVLELTDPGAAGWALIIPASLVPILAAPVVSAVVARWRRPR